MLAAGVAAGQSASVGLTPATVVHTFKPGKPFHFDMSLSNGLSKPVNVRALVQDWWYNERNEKVFSVAGSHGNSASNWIQFVPEQITIEANSSAKVRVVVTPPASTVGGYYSVLFFESRPELSTEVTNEGKPVFTNFRLGALVMLEAENTTTFKINVSERKFTPPSANGNLVYAFSVHNQGNTHIFPKADVALLNQNGELVAKAEAQVKRLLPNQKDTMSVEWGGQLPPGKYLAMLNVVYGTGNVYTDEVSFEVKGN